MDKLVLSMVPFPAVYGESFVDILRLCDYTAFDLHCNALRTHDESWGDCNFDNVSLGAKSDECWILETNEEKALVLSVDLDADSPELWYDYRNRHLSDKKEHTINFDNWCGNPAKCGYITGDGAIIFLSPSFPNMAIRLRANDVDIEEDLRDFYWKNLKSAINFRVVSPLGIERISENESIKQSENLHENKEETSMNMSQNFGIRQLESDQIASTMLGIAVKYGDSWRIYDKKKEEITDVGNIQFGNFPIWVIPTFKLAPGDILIDDDKFYCVTGKNKKIQTVDMATGKTHSIVPIKNILGFSIYEKIVAFTDMGDLGVDGDKKLLMLAMMSGNNDNNQMQSLMPFLFLGGKSEVDTDNLFLLSMMSGNTSGFDGQNGLMQLLMMKKLLGDDGENPLSALLGETADE